MSKGMGLDVDDADIEALVEGHKEALMMEELTELQSEQPKVLDEEHH